MAGTVALPSIPLPASSRSSILTVIQAMEKVLDPSTSDIAKFLFLRHLQRRQPDVFYHVLVSHTEDVLPFLYTPTVGEACQRYHQLGIPTYGLYLRASERGRFLELLQALPAHQQNISVVVVTDGERILGLGDLGAGGMGISEGKSLLYTAAAGVPPHAILPICLDVGTNNVALREDPQYHGLRQPRLAGAEYNAIVAELVAALQEWRPHVVLQWEDFGNSNAFRLLLKYRRTLCSFNDDIQGTACITVAGLLSALRATGSSLPQQQVLFLGAGEAGTGIGELIAIALEKRHGMTREQARRHCLFMDSKGLVCASRTDLQPHKVAFAHDVPPCKTLIEAVRTLRPTALVGVSTSRGAFNREVLEAMAEINARPIVFPLSNPTSKAECTYEEAFDATQGRLLFASGSPFAPLQRGGREYTPAQANNAYVFPAIGHAAVLCRASAITDEVFLLAAEALAGLTSAEELQQGMLFPRFSNIRKLSGGLMAAIAQDMCTSGLGAVPADFEQVTAGLAEGATSLQRWEAYSRARMYEPPAEVAESFAQSSQASPRL